MDTQTQGNAAVKMEGIKEENWRDAFFFRLSLNEKRTGEKINLFLFIMFVLTTIGILVVSEQNGRIADLKARLDKIAPEKLEE